MSRMKALFDVLLAISVGDNIAGDDCTWHDVYSLMDMGLVGLEKSTGNVWTVFVSDRGRDVIAELTS